MPEILGDELVGVGKVDPGVVRNLSGGKVSLVSDGVRKIDLHFLNVDVFEFFGN